MKKVLFKKAEFLTSALKTDELPDTKLPEIAIVGRSNVGKSSLINHLLRSKVVAKVSSTPGKTQRINYFVIDESLLLVDLPGYGYAKVPQHIRKMLSKASACCAFALSSMKIIHFQEECSGEGNGEGELKAYCTTKPPKSIVP